MAPPTPPRACSPRPPAARAFALADLAPQPWRNGRGLTREILVRAASDGGWDWRVSVADIDKDGAFSTFDGVDRAAALLRGPGLVLAGDARSADVVFDRIGAVRRFAGETALRARLHGAPARLFNVMTRRGAAAECLEPRTDAGELALGDAEAAVLFVAEGWFSVEVEVRADVESQAKAQDQDRDRNQGGARAVAEAGGGARGRWRGDRRRDEGLSIASGSAILRWRSLAPSGRLLVCALRPIQP
ncbi:MAG: HutD family protein [Burkholderiaceae bacterium]